MYVAAGLFAAGLLAVPCFGQPSGKTSKSSKKAAPPPPVTLSITHDASACVVAGEYPQVEACLDPREAVGRAQIHFHAASADPWYSVDMKPDGRCYTGLLPKPLKSLGAFEYYVLAVDRSFTSKTFPTSAPAEPIRVKVARRESGCRGVSTMARATSLSAPILVSLVGSSGAAAASTAGLVATVAGFSAEGLAGAASMAVGTAAASGAQAAGGAGAAGGGGAISTQTLLIGAAAVTATVGGIAVASGSKDSDVLCTTAMIVQNSGGLIEAVGDDVCGPLQVPLCPNGQAWRACVATPCGPQCGALYMAADGRRFPCDNRLNCGVSTQLPAGTSAPECLSAATALIAYLCP